MRGLVCGLAALLLVACASEGPRVQVEKAFEACVEGVRKGDAKGVAERLSPRFEGPEGLDKGGAGLLLAGLFRQQKVGVTVLLQKIDLQGADAATQTADLLLTGREGKSILPDDTTRKRYLLRWERREGKWLLRELREITGEG